MNHFPSSPPQSPVTPLDESSTHTIKSTSQAVSSISAALSTIPQSDAPPSYQQPPALPTHLDSPIRSNSRNINTSMSLVQSSPQPNSSSQSLNMTAASFHSSSSRHSPPLADPISSSGNKPADASSPQPDSGIITSPVILPTKSHHSITPSFSFPGAHASASSFDTMFQISTDSRYSLTSPSSTEEISSDSCSQRTPNVYINGLPANFSEQDLFHLAQPFGEIKSVRTFTRHVSEKPTGYGFVLFSDVASAQKCIEGLRKYRNLHPSFSKQVHRIPGTEYAQYNAAQPGEHEENTFKSRMEKLKDSSSTNLYIEGLPLSIDDESLAALMLPYKIKSSRFFKTKLSNPPRIIAFVRLETRTAAEQTIERLHGRMVRGWNDPGCRISVRFADSAEQRELRRAERSLKNGDQSPSRLTIAQAALLNLRGQEFQSNARHVAGSQSHRSANTQRSRPDSQAALDRAPASGVLPSSLSLPSNLCYAYKGSPFLPTSDLPIASDMDNLIQSIQNMGYEDGSLDTMRSAAIENEYLLAQQAQLRALANAALLSSKPLPLTLPRGQTQARNGFTPAEELILEAHARHVQLQAQIPRPSPAFEQLPSTRGLNANVPIFEPPPLESFQVNAPVGRPIPSQNALPVTLGDEFHVMGHYPHNFARSAHEFQGPLNECAPIGSGTPSTIFVRPPSRAVSIVPPPPDYEEHVKRSKGQQRSEPSIESKQIPNHSSSTNSRQSGALGGQKLHTSYLQTSTCPNQISSNNSTSAISNDSDPEQHQPNYTYPRGNLQSGPDDNRPRLRSLQSSHVHTNKSPSLCGPHSIVKEGRKSPSAVSPALTYCSRTPSTLSPATPFFGSFTGNQDTFDVVTMENEDAVERKLKVRAVGK